MQTSSKIISWNSCHDSAITNLTSIHEDMSLIPGLTQWVKDLVWLWLEHKLEATAPIWPLARELPYTAGVALKRHTHTQKNCISSPYLSAFPTQLANWLINTSIGHFKYSSINLSITDLIISFLLCPPKFGLPPMCLSQCIPSPHNQLHKSKPWLFFIYLFIFFLGPYLLHMEVPRLGVELEL